MSPQFLKKSIAPRGGTVWSVFCVLCVSGTARDLKSESNVMNFKAFDKYLGPVGWRRRGQWYGNRVPVTVLRIGVNGLAEG